MIAENNFKTEISPNWRCCEMTKITGGGNLAYRVAKNRVFEGRELSLKR